MSDLKDELKRVQTRPTTTITTTHQQKEKKILVQDVMDLSSEKEVKGLGGPAPTISASYIQNLVFHPVAEHDPDRVGPHYAPCPAPSGGDIARDRAINEWVLNHLPLKEEEKKKLMDDLYLEQRKHEILSESLTMRSKNLQRLQEKEKEKQQEQEETDKGHRLGVKEQPKKRNCTTCFCS